MFLTLICLIYKQNKIKNMNKTFKTEDIDRIEKSIKQGEKIKRIDRIFYQNINGTRKAGDRKSVV